MDECARCHRQGYIDELSGWCQECLNGPVKAQGEQTAVSWEQLLLRESCRTREEMLALCACGHYRMMHREDERECLFCNAPISRPTACFDGTCCHNFQAALP